MTTRAERAAEALQEWLGAHPRLRVSRSVMTGDRPRVGVAVASDESGGESLSIHFRPSGIYIWTTQRSRIAQERYDLADAEMQAARFWEEAGREFTVASGTIRVTPEMWARSEETRRHMVAEMRRLDRQRTDRVMAATVDLIRAGMALGEPVEGSPPEVAALVLDLRPERG